MGAEQELRRRKEVAQLEGERDRLKAEVDRLKGQLTADALAYEGDVNRLRKGFNFQVEEWKEKAVNVNLAACQAAYKKGLADADLQNERYRKALEKLSKGLPCDTMPTSGHTRSWDWWQAYLQRADKSVKDIANAALNDKTNDSRPEPVPVATTELRINAKEYLCLRCNMTVPENAPCPRCGA